MVNPHLPQLPDEISFASELIKARSELGLTQATLAEKSGLSLSAVKAYESGRNMPGARELRELCQALQVSPNKLLFGTELPFQTRTLGNMIVDGDTEDQMMLRMRLAFLSSMLASDERMALFTLAQSIAVARHGEEKIRVALKEADVLTGIGLSLKKSTRDALVKNKPLDPSGMEQDVDTFMEKQGHLPPPTKLPKK